MSELPEIFRFRLPATTRISRVPPRKTPKPAPVDTVEVDEEVPAESATAGTPGEFAPPGAQRPRTVKEMADIVPIPDTPWNEGESVRLASNNYTHWAGDRWRSGKAPALT